MATIFNVTFLGTAAVFDPTEGITTVENASALAGLTYGNAGAPLHGNLRSFSPGTGGFVGGDATRYDTDNASSRECFQLDGGADQVFDSVFVYDSTVTYTDGTTAFAQTVLFQDTAGNLYLAPHRSQTADQDTLEARPIRSLTLDTFVSESAGPIADRVSGAYFEPDSVVDSTAGDDTISGDADLDGFTNDQLDVGARRVPKGYPGNGDDVTVKVNRSGHVRDSFPMGETNVLQSVPVARMSSRTRLISAGIPCFTAGTPILTPRGPIMVEMLCAGDLVMTRDNGLQPIVWVGKRHLGRKDLLAMPKLRPIRVTAGTFGNETNVLFSPQHGLLLRDKCSGVPEFFVRAGHLARIKGGKVGVAHGVSSVTYVHLMFESHQVVMSAGIWSESFYPGPQAMASLHSAEAAELAALFPALACDAIESGYGLQARNFAPFGGLTPHLSALVPVAV